MLSGALTSPAAAQTADTKTPQPSTATGRAADLEVSPRFGASFTTTGAGYQDPFFSIEGFVPLQHSGRDLTFLEGKVLYLTDSTMGGNLLLGHRFYSSSQNSVLGGYISYDFRDTGRNFFNQIGAGFERLGDSWDFRVNGYLPVGSTREQTFESLSNPTFQQNFLLLGRSRQFEAAMRGFDVEAGGRLLRLGEGDLRGYAGVYYYGAEGSKDAFGVRGRLEARPNDSLNLGVTVQNDPLFDTRVVLSLGVNFPGTRPRGVKRPSALARIGESVERISTITVDRQKKNDTIVALNPKTGTPFLFRHVNLGLGQGNGTYENPTGTVQDALNVAQSNDIVYVQSGTNPGIPAFTIPDGVSVLSTGPVQRIDTVQLKAVQLPLSGSGNFPTVTGTISLGNDTTLSGFAIANAVGSGVQGTNIQNVTIQDNRITNPTQQGINLIGVTGTSAIANNTITNSGLQGIFVQAFGSNQQEILASSNTISGSGSQGIFIQAAEGARQKFTANGNTVSGSNGQGIFAQASGSTTQELAINNSRVDSTRVGSDGTGGQGIFVQSANQAQQNITVDGSTVSNSAGQGIFAQASGSGQQNFAANSNTVSNSTGQGIFIQAAGNTQQTDNISKNTVDSTNKGSDGSGGQGIFVQAAEQTQQNVTANDNTVSNSKGQGIFVQASGGTRQQFTANSNTISGSKGQGIFAQAAGNTLQEINISDSKINSTGLGSDGTGGQGIFIQAAEQAQQNSTVRGSTISNSAGQGVFVQASGSTQQQFTADSNTISNSAGQGLFVQASGSTRQNITGNSNTVSGSSQGIFAQAAGNTQQQFTLNGNTISDSNGQGIFVQAAENAQQNFSLTNNTIKNTALDGVFIQASNTAQISAIVQANTLKNNSTYGLTAFMNSTKNLCLGLKGNNSGNILLQRNAGIFQVVDRDNVNANNTVTVNFAPGIGDFTNVPACP